MPETSTINNEAIFMALSKSFTSLEARNLMLMLLILALGLITCNVFIIAICWLNNVHVS
ncbi:MAG: hypothetical protein F6K14_07910 [Symploca sp. SIO2C1]|nr:hypothetical protein [Symploca sp. SIO2C1]